MRDLVEFVDAYVLVGALIVFGATANALAQLAHVRKHEGGTFDKIDFLIAVVISAFSGTIFGIVATYVWSDPLAVHGVAGVGAFLGLKGLNKLSEILIEVLQRKGSGK